MVKKSFMHTLKAIGSYLVDLARGVPTKNMLASMSDKELMAQINYDAEDNRINTVYAEEYRRRNSKRCA